MTKEDLLALLPLILSAYLPVVVMMLSAFWRNAAGIAALSLLSLALSFASIFIVLPYAPRTVFSLISIDGFSMFFMGLIFLAGMAIILISREYLMGHEEREDRLYPLLLFAVFGGAVAASSNHFASFFLGLETLTVSLYGLVGFTRVRHVSLESGIKYLVMAASSSAFLLFGIALIYTDWGTLSFTQLAMRFAGARGSLPSVTLLGFALILVGFGFKLALAPFHMWSPDVYQGAPAPSTALISTISKGAVFALFLRLVATLGLGADARMNPLVLLITILAILTMFTGNLLALLQRNVKRLLAYSSIANMGYLLIPLLAWRTSGGEAFGFYLVSYFATVIAAFGVIAVLSSRGVEIEDLDDYRGLGYQQPLMALVLALMMLSLTGIPLTSGFIAKFYIFRAGVWSGLWMLVIIALINSGISAFYYLRVLTTMYIHSGPPRTQLATPRGWAASSLALLTAVVVFFGVYPSPLIRLAETAIRSIPPFR